MLQDESFDITVVAPDDAPPHCVSVFKLESDQDNRLGSNGSPALSPHDGTSSGGYTTPDTPYHPFLDLNAVNNHFTSSMEHEYSKGPLRLSPQHMPFSPNTLSPVSHSFLSLSINDSSSPRSPDASNSFDHEPSNNRHYAGPMHSDIDDSYMIQRSLSHSGSESNRASLSPLIIPQVIPPSTHANYLWSGQTPNDQDPQDGSDEFIRSIFHFDEIESATQTVLPGERDSNQSASIQNGLESLLDGPFLHRFQKPQGTHARHSSEIGTAWTSSSGSSGNQTSQSYGYSPSEHASSASSSLLETPYCDDFRTSVATVQRRHSHSGGKPGIHVNTGIGPDRGRTDGRVPLSASTSRRSSPYPPSRPLPETSPSTLSPCQIFESDHHLAVPRPTEDFVTFGDSVKRRHSFTQTGCSSTSTSLKPNDLQSTTGQLLPLDDIAIPIGRPVRKVASQAGIKASEARRTKDAKFSCVLCGQTFTTNHNLKNHVNVHLGYRDHPCHRCNRQFTTQSVLARHLKTCKVPEPLSQQISPSS